MMRTAIVHALLFVTCASLGAACSSDAGEESSAGATTGSAPVPGTSAEGWMSVFDEGGVAFACDDDEAELLAAGVPYLAFESTTLFVGYEQIGDNQNPLLARFDAGELVYCQRHESQGPDGRALGLTWDGGEDAYLVYTIVGGGSDLEGKGGWLSSYAPGSISGGGPKVSVVGRVSVSDGSLSTATFVIAVKSDRKVNSHRPTHAATVLENGNIEFLGASAHKAIDADGSTAMDCTDYPFDTRYIFSPALDELRCAESTNCVSMQPCP